MDKSWKELLLENGWPLESIKDMTEDECQDEYYYALESC